MERLVITVHPSPSDNVRLPVADAMQQVIDLLRLHEEAERAMGSQAESFEWRLERASTNSPLTIVALAEARDRTTNVDAYVRRVKGEVSSGIRSLVYHNEPPTWMGTEALEVAGKLFTRNQNGIGVTEIESGPDDSFAIDRTRAEAGLRTISEITAVSAQTDVLARRAWGEIQGVMVAAGRHYSKPAIVIRSAQYGEIWCRLSQQLIERYGVEHRLTKVWDGKTVGVEGDLIYGAGGALSRVDATDIRDIEQVPAIDLASVLNHDFTSGLDPAEYTRQLWEGALAS